MGSNFSRFNLSAPVWPTTIKFGTITQREALFRYERTPAPNPRGAAAETQKFWGTSFRANKLLSEDFQSLVVTSLSKDTSLTNFSRSGVFMWSF